VTHCALFWFLSVVMWIEDLDAAEDALGAFAERAEVNAHGS
jgi:hypothetical protein